MNKLLFKLIGVLFLASALIFTSCDDDEPSVDAGGDGTFNVNDGFYLTKVGSNPDFNGLLSTEQVEEGTSFDPVDLAGFYGGFKYLTVGSYSLVQITDKEAVDTIGGTSEVLSDVDQSECDFNDYTVITTADGGSFTVDTEGFYKVTYSVSAAEMVLHKIEQVNLRGGALDDGPEIEIPGMVNADGGSWSLADVVIRSSNNFKLRYNCRWKIDRRIDDSQASSETNGYILFTNFGGTPDNLTAGGANIVVDEDGTYTVNIAWDPIDGFTMTLDRTGDAPELSFVPEDWQWGLIGSATSNGWDADRKFMYKFDEGTSTHTWHGVFTLVQDGEFKMRSDENWTNELGGALAPDGMETVMTRGDNIPSPGAGSYYIVIKTDDDGTTWKVTMTDIGWGIIGDGSPANGWDPDLDLTADDVDGFATPGITTYSLSGMFTAAGTYKFRANDDWAFNIGGDPADLTFDGNNLAVAEDGEYDVVLTFDGTKYSVTVTKR